MVCTVRAAVSPTTGAKRGTIWSAWPLACSRAAAMRQGSRAAISPPGSMSGARCPTRSQRAPCTHSSSPPQAVPSSPRPTPSSVRAITGSCTPCSASTAAAWAWWCCTATAGRPRSPATRSARRVLKKSGCRSCATASSGAPGRASRSSTDCSSAAQAAGSDRSPCTADHSGARGVWVSNRQALFFRKAPQARMRAMAPPQPCPALSRASSASSCAMRVCTLVGSMASGCSSQSSQASMPSPVVAESCRMRMPGLTRRA